jgi:hypothetical protein
MPNTITKPQEHVISAGKRGTTPYNGRVLDHPTALLRNVRSDGNYECDR